MKSSGSLRSKAVAKARIDPPQVAVEGAGLVPHRVGQHLVDEAHGVEQTDRRVDHQDLLEVEDLPFLVQAGQEGRLGAAQTVARQIEFGNVHPVGHLLIGQFHHAVEILTVVDDVAGDFGRRGVDDEIHVGGRRDRDDAETGLVEGPLQPLHLGGLVAGPGAGDHEDQRGALLLAHEGKLQALAVPEHVRDLTVLENRQADNP